mgnify:CR=1 FL=1
MNVGAESWIADVSATKFETISASEYARRHGLSVAALYYWRRKLKPNVGAGRVGWESKFIALRVAAPCPCSCTLVTPFGLHLEMSTLPAPGWLAAPDRILPDVR